MAPKRSRGLAAALANGVNAGNIESSSGSARAVPAPFNSVRRASDFFVTNIGLDSIIGFRLIEWGLPRFRAAPPSSSGTAYYVPRHEGSPKTGNSVWPRRAESRARRAY